MARIRAEELANYVDTNRKLGVDILNSKNISSSYNDSLNDVINNITKLPDNPKEDDIEYDYPQEFKDLISAYENDPLLEMNGGEYNKCVYYGLENDYDTTYLYGSFDRVLTSDGQDILRHNHDSITWDTTKDLIRENGKGWRWLKCYEKVEGAYLQSVGSISVSGCYPTNNTTNESSLKFILIDGISQSQGGKSYTSISETKTECLVFGKSTPYVGIGYFAQGDDLSYPQYKTSSTSGALPNLQYIVNLNDERAYIRPYYTTKIKKMEGKFRYLSSIVYNDIVDYEYIGNNFPSWSGYIKFPNDTFNIKCKYITSSSSFSPYATTIKKIYLPEIEEWGSASPINGSSTNRLEYLYIGDKLKTAFRLGSGFYLFKFLRIPTNYSFVLALGDLYSLTKECVLDIFNRIADLTGQTSLTIKLPKHIELTEEELAIATNKNWTVTFA